MIYLINTIIHIKAKQKSVDVKSSTYIDLMIKILNLELVISLECQK